MKTRIFNPFRSGISAVLSVLTLGCIAASSASALTVTWTGANVTDGHWPGNGWANFGGTVVGIDDDVVFGPANLNGWTLTSTGGAKRLSSLTFKAGSPAYDIRFANGVAGATFYNFNFKVGNTGITVEAGDLSNHTIGQGSLGGIINMLDNLTVTHNGSGALAFDEAIAGAATFALTKEGTGTMKLNAANTYAGATQVNGGILVFGKTAAKASGTVTAGASGIVGLGVGGTGYYTAADVASLSANTLTGFNLDPTSGVAIDTTAASLASQGGAVIEGTRSLTKLGANLAQLNATNTYSGATIIKEGELNLGSGTAGGKLSNTSTITVESGAGFGIWQNDAVNQGVDFNNAPITGAGDFYIIGSPKVTLTAANNYTGTTTIAGGLLKHEGSATLTSGNLIFDGSTSGVLGLTDNFTRNLGTGVGEVQWTKSGGFAAFSADRTVSLNGGGSVQWASGSFLLGSRFLILGHPDATHSVTFTNDINFGIPEAAVIKTRDIRVDDGAAAVDAVISGILASGGTLGGFNKVGTGTLELTNANTYTGITNIQEGRLNFSVTADGASSSSLGSSSNAAENLLLGNSSTLSYIGEGGSTDRSFTINGTAGGNQATLDASGSGPMNFTSTASPAYGTADQSRVLILGGTNTGDNTLAANIANNGAGGNVQIRKTGAGKWILSGTSTYAGRTDIQQGVLEFKVVANGASDSSLGKSGLAQANLLLGHTATLRYTGTGGSTNRLFTINGTAAGHNAILDASGSGPISFTNNTASPAYGTLDQSRTLILDGTNTGDNTLAAGVADNGTGAVSIAKNGTGKWILSGTSSNSGTVNITNGTLLINGSLSNATSNLNVLGGTLGGTGTIAKQVAMQPNGSLSPGASVGTLTLGANLTFGPFTGTTTGKLVYELGAIGSSDKIDLTTGTLVFGNAVIDLEDFDLTAVAGFENGTYTLISTTLPISGPLGPITTGTLNGKNISLEKGDSNTDLVLVVSSSGSAYDTWATSKGLTGLPGSSTDPAKNADPDKDGRNNLAEFAFHGDPLSGSDNGKVYVLTEDSDVDGDTTKELLLTIAVRTGTPAFAGSPPSANLAADSITYNVEGSLNLASFATTVNVVPTPVTTGLPAAGDGYEYRSFSLDGSNGLTGKGFLRAKVTSP